MFNLQSAAATLTDAFPGMSDEAQLFAGLESLANNLLAREFRREDGANLQVAKLLIDSGYARGAVCELCRKVGQGERIMPSLGVGCGAKKKPMAEWKKGPGERSGWHWFLGATESYRGLLTAKIDVNYWKSFIATRLAAPAGSAACLTLFGDHHADHRLLGEHLTSESGLIVSADSGSGRRTVTEWVAKPNRDNHWFDCVVGCAAAASMAGITAVGTVGPTIKKRVRVRLSELQRSKHDGYGS